jgi:hypothetical protein
MDINHPWKDAFIKDLCITIKRNFEGQPTTYVTKCIIPTTWYLSLKPLVIRTTKHPWIINECNTHHLQRIFFNKSSRKVWGPSVLAIDSCSHRKQPWLGVCSLVHGRKRCQELMGLHIDIDGTVSEMGSQASRFSVCRRCGYLDQAW